MKGTRIKALCAAKDYESIYRFLNTITNSPAAVVSDEDTEMLQSYINNEIKTIIYADKVIPGPLIRSAKLYGKEYYISVKETVSTHICAKYISEYQKFLTTSFVDLKSIKSCFIWKEDAIGKAEFKFSNLPKEWAITLDVLTKFYVLTKQKLTDYFFYCEIIEKDFCESLELTIRFEKKFGRYFSKYKCCGSTESDKAKSNASIVFLGDGLIEFGEPSLDKRHQVKRCRHYNLLSQVFVPNFKIYLKRSFDLTLKKNYSQRLIEMHIFSGFLDFIRELEKIYQVVEYVNDRNVYSLLISYFDAYLSILLRNLEKEFDIYYAGVVLNTLTFITESITDFITRISSIVHIDIPELKSKAEIKRVELVHENLIEDYIRDCMIRSEIPSNRLSKTVIDFFNSKILTEKFGGFCREVTSTLIESVITFVFSNIIQLKMTPEVAETLLLEMAEIKKYLKERVSIIPMISVVEKYLKIFLCPIDDLDSFVNNFLLLSNGTFSFSQILKSLDNQSQATELFLKYKKLENK